MVSKHFQPPGTITVLSNLQTAYFEFDFTLDDGTEVAAINTPTVAVSDASILAAAIVTATSGDLLAFGVTVTPVAAAIGPCDVTISEDNGQHILHRSMKFQVTGTMPTKIEATTPVVT